MTFRAGHPEVQISGLDLTGLLREVLEKGAAFRFKATGFSMTPIVKDGDIITVSPCRPRQLRSGDIAAFVSPASDRLVVHRIVGTQDESFFIKGDNAPGYDGLIHGSRVLGRVTRIERDGCNVRLGLGIERKVLALFSRLRILPLLLAPARKLYRLWTGRTLTT